MEEPGGVVHAHDYEHLPQVHVYFGFSGDDCDLHFSAKGERRLPVASADGERAMGCEEGAESYDDGA